MSPAGPKSQRGRASERAASTTCLTVWNHGGAGERWSSPSPAPAAAARDWPSKSPGSRPFNPPTQPGLHPRALAPPSLHSAAAKAAACLGSSTGRQQLSGASSRTAGGCPGRAMTSPLRSHLWLLLLGWALAGGGGGAAPKRKPAFRGHVPENWPAGSRVAGLSIPLTRLGPEPWCAKVQGRRWHLQLLGEGHAHFQVALHARSGQVWLRTTRPLDREARALYALRLALCCKRCSPSGRSAPSELATVAVAVLDANDNAPRFVPRPGSGPAVTRLRVAETLALRAQVWQALAQDSDAGANAELRYFARPGSAHFFVVPRSGRVVLVRSLLNVRAPIPLRLFARDRGQPALLSAPLDLEVLPEPVELPLGRSNSSSSSRRRRRRGRSARALLRPEPPLALALPEDARPGTLLASLGPAARFASARFELVSPPPDDAPVRLDRDTGEVTLARSLDREAVARWEIICRVQERAGKNWYLVHLELTVTDVNDNVPEWTMEPFPYLATVSPKASAGTKVYKLSAKDQDAEENGAVEYFLEEGGEDRFEVERDTGWVKTTGLPLVKEREYLLTVVAADKPGRRGSPASIFVAAGRRPPQFANTSYAVYVPENTPQGKSFLTVSALSHQNKSLSYSLITNPHGLFGINQATGDIYFSRNMDYESDQHQYLLLVQARENQGQLSSTVEVWVVITDVNDCAPEFQQSIYTKDNVPETVTVTSALLQVSSSDCDFEENAEISYYTLSPDFSISTHGTIFPATQLDYERPNHLYEFVIMAVDKGDPPRTGTATVRIRVSNVNDEVPKFSQPIYRSFVSEDAGPNTLIATVHAIDPDGDGVSYSITGGNQKGNFVIDSQKGLIRLRSNPLPKLQGPEYVLNVTATDDNASGGPHSLTSTAQVVVHVDDVNNNKPIFQKCQYYREHASVLENQPVGTFVLQVEATDEDEAANGRVKYGLMHRDGALPAFNIHPDTGVLTTLQIFDREKQREHPITVTATDQAAEPLIGICQINVAILDVNDNSPRFENSYYEYFLREDTNVGTSFLRVAAHDDDYGSNASVTYSAAGGKTRYFQVNPTTGWVYVSQPMMQKSFITEEIIAMDGGNRSTKVELRVTVTSAKNQPPQWERDSYEVVIPENTTRDTSIVTIKATSPLGDPRITYNLEEGLVPETNMPIRFYLTPNRDDGSASILIAEPLDYETTKTFLLRIRAQNVAAVPLAAFAIVYVNVTDVNDNVPFFTSSIYEASVTEGAEIGTLVLQVSATDLDLGRNGEITYSLLPDRSGDYTFFHLDSKTGSIYTASVFDREKKASYLLEVKSTDGSESARPGKHGQPNSDTAYVRIFISDVNDNKPIFTKSVYEINVDEDRDVGSTVVTVSANDEDEGANAKLRYQITAGNTGGAFDVEPETGVVFIAQPLDYEEAQLYELHLLASDGKWEDYAIVLISVVNKNDEAPVFALNEYYGSVIEELDGLPVFVLQVVANDPDSSMDGGDLRYSLHGHGADDVFAIDENTGSIYSQKVLDREERAFWRFVVLATDEGGEGLTGFADVIINVWDINDNTPVFTCMPNDCNGSVFENSPGDTFIMEMTAVDSDDPNVGLNAILTYHIIENVKNEFDMDLFKINPTTGNIYVAGGMLDREEMDIYFLTVEAKDGGGLTGTGTATIWVADVNDHIPSFTRELCHAIIPETSAVNSEVLEVLAADEDSGENAQLTFSIIGGDLGQKFYIENQDGQHATIKLKKPLDYEQIHERQFNLTIKVEDLDFSSVASCLIEVEDRNDHSPVFSSQFVQLSPFFENIPVGTTIITVTAVDEDSGLNGDIEYSIQLESDPSEQFAVDQDGHVTVAKELDREVIQEYALVIQASDQGLPAQTGSVTILIDLLDVNDNGPRFEALYTPVVWENTPGPQLVYMNPTSSLLWAFDPDSDGNGPPFLFFFPPDYQNTLDFSLTDNGNNTATITALRSFDREKQKAFHLPIIITDSGNPPMSSTNILTITIGDENDNSHEAGHKEIYVYTHRGKWSTTVLGEVFAPDQDDWDNKTFVSEGKIHKSFRLNQRTGSLIMVDDAPQGIYELKIRVSDGIWPDVVASVQIHVKEIENEAIRNSATVRLADMTAEEFVRKDEPEESRHDKFKDLLAGILSVLPDDVIVFSVTNVDGKQTDVRFAVQNGSSYYRPEKLQGQIAAFKNKIQLALGVNVSQVDVDECRRMDCSGSSGCTNYITVSDIPTVMDTGSVSLVSITTSVSAVCTCAARDRVHRSCSSYSHNPCFNGGTCIDMLNGYRCRCSASFHGPDCQQTKHSFHGNGYAWFRPIRPCFESSLSLEFITDVPDGLLLYNGPLSDSDLRNSENFIAIELSRGIPVLKISHGLGTVELHLPSYVNVTDQRWHRLEMRSSKQDVRFILDQCKAAIVSEIEGVGKWLSTEDRTNCEVMGFVPQARRYLNMNQVLQLGGVKDSIPYSYPQLQHKHFTGCIRNLIVDTQVYDLESPAESLNSSPGCALADSSCEKMGSSPCGGHGQCLGEPASFACHCLPGYYGYKCDKAAEESSFGPESYIRYQLPVAIPARRTLVEAMIRTRQPSGIILNMSSRNKDEHITLQVVQGLLAVSYNLGDGALAVVLPSYQIDNGEWHHVSLERNENEFILRLDEGGGKREIHKAAGTYKEIIIDPHSLVVGNIYPANQTHGFQGCMKDVRFNNYGLPLDPHPKELVLSAQGVKKGCLSEACKSNPCSQQFICIDLWMMHECSCPPGHMLVENATGRHCLYTACAQRPCNFGTCISQSASKFRCHCPDGYAGRNCEITLAIFHKDAGLSFSSMFAICICFLALLVLFSGVFLWTRWKSRKSMDGGIYHVTTCHDDLEDIRENILNYNEEGGGEQDQDAYNMAELQMSLQTSPAYSLYKKKGKRTELQSPVSCDFPLSPKEPLEAAVGAGRGSSSFSSLDFGCYLSGVVRNVDQQHHALPCDSLQVFYTEGECSEASSLSSLGSCGWDEDTVYGDIKDWGPKFEKLSELYSHAEPDDI
ncbi:neural-cadherin-like [Hemicordylus capensis]|uniref:neural-cadherin-like n=1 Tax=Hemicordylus capensis TaxID=884348 RepID=UPI0023029BF7|nr:neural-cadherin-like [Hemicordylus capensis]